MFKRHTESPRLSLHTRLMCCVFKLVAYLFDVLCVQNFTEASDAGRMSGTHSTVRTRRTQCLRKLVGAQCKTRGCLCPPTNPFEKLGNPEGLSGGCHLTEKRLLGGFAGASDWTEENDSAQAKRSQVIQISELSAARPNHKEACTHICFCGKETTTTSTHAAA